MAHALVPAQYLPGRVHDVPGPQRVGAALTDQVDIVTTDEADFLAVGFVGDGQAQLGGDLPNAGLVGHLADRQQDPPEVFAGDAEQGVGLVLVGGAMDRPVDHPGVMSGGDVAGAEGVRPGDQARELDPRVAVDAWVGRPAGGVFVHEVVDDGGELRPRVEDIQVDPEFLGDPAGVGLVPGAAASAGVVVEIHRPAQAEEDPGHVVARLDQHRGRDRTVHSAAHGEKHAVWVVGHRCIIVSIQESSRSGKRDPRKAFRGR